MDASKFTNGMSGWARERGGCGSASSGDCTDYTITIMLSDYDCDCIPGDNAFPVALDNLYCNRFEEL